ncbi:hypothetical protein NBRC10513_001056 [Rhodotorula toruloides]|uniref:Organic solute transporter Ostalpha-domain containing protein n=1 Tax=Rhodotorula toruloides TaxID=5286 RepID=A0A2T0A1T7_RHOTO|nr:Organic solute transporter Ostalpha-domain containing protein [Rhodotorula toruloides]
MRWAAWFAALTWLATLANASEAASAAKDGGAGSGSKLPLWVLVSATISAGLSTILSLGTIWLQLKHYHKPRLQRLVVRILVMVPIYSLSTLISLYSLDLAFFVDAVRDIYEAFVIYCFFSLLVEYLGGERSLIITLHGREPVKHPFPVSLFLRPMDASDPFTFLGLKRGILQYVQIKPILAAATVILKATGTYNDGALRKDSGYTYVSIVYNLSVSLSLYCLAMFWVATNDDLKPYRPMPKFLCVKGLIFMTFWQGFAVSILVATGLLRTSRYDSEELSVAIQDTLLCLQMPLFAFLHLYAFSYTDYIDEKHIYSGRLPVWHAFKDAFGYKDLLLDSLTTLKGTGFSYRTFEPASGALHAEGLSRDRRIRAGLRYSASGQRKYWLNQPGAEEDAFGRRGEGILKRGLAARPLHEIGRVLEERLEQHEGYAPLSHEEDEGGVVRVDPEWRAEELARQKATGGGAVVGVGWWEGGRTYDDLSDGEESEPESLDFADPRDAEEKDMEKLYREARELEYGDWSYPVLDASREAARRRIRDEEDALLSGKYGARRRRGKGKDALRPPAQHRPGSYGALAEREPLARQSSSAEPSSSSPRDRNSPRPPSADPLPSPPTQHQTSAPSDPPTSADHPAALGSSIIHGAHDLLHSAPDDAARLAARLRLRKKQEQSRLPPDAVDLVVEDTQAEEEEQIRQRRRGEPGGKKTRVYRLAYVPPELRGKDRADEEERKKGKEVEDVVPGEQARVKDVVEREEEQDGPLPPPEGTVQGGNEGRKDEVVRIVVEEEEQQARQAGVDERPPSAPVGGSRGGVLDAADNPWR